MVDFHIRGTKENASVLDPMFHVLEEEDRLRQTREQSIYDVHSVRVSLPPLLVSLSYSRNLSVFLLLSAFMVAPCFSSLDVVCTCPQPTARRARRPPGRHEASVGRGKGPNINYVFEGSSNNPSPTLSTTSYVKPKWMNEAVAF